ncbi:MAG: methyltransferase domain-containing protein [Bacteroidota bacterium]
MKNTNSIYTYASGWIHKQENIHHWMYYWHQINLVRSRIKEGDRILEIGVGTKFTSDYLRSKGFEVVTMDIDPDKKPDIVGNIVEDELKEEFDFVLAFEVFEHIPFEDFVKVLAKIHPICRKNLLISLPRNEKQWLKLTAELPGRKTYGFRITTLRRKVISTHHHWEVDFSPYTKKMLEQTFRDHKFSVEDCRKVSSLYFYSLQNQRD